MRLPNSPPATIHPRVYRYRDAFVESIRKTYGAPQPYVEDYFDELIAESPDATFRERMNSVLTVDEFKELRSMIAEMESDLFQSLFDQWHEQMQIDRDRN